MLTLEEAQQRILAQLPPPRSARSPLAAAGRLFLTEPVTSQVDLPLFDNSAMDGYAVRSAELSRATAQIPVTLRRIGEAAAGQVFDGEVAAGTCVRVSTGSPLPRGADAVVMQEDTRTDPANSGVILVLDAVKPWENVRFRGEDVKHGATLGETGARLGVGRVSLLAAAGVREVRVGRRPRVALLATGSELREAGQPLGPGQIYESNRAGLAALIRRHGGLPEAFPLVPDDLAATRTALERAFTASDVVLTSGGVSVGELDFVKAAFEQLGGRIELWRVAMKPGKPFVFGRWREKFIFGLPGNPVSALVTCCVLVLPALARLQGAADVALPGSAGVLAEPLVNRGDRRHFVRVRLDAEGQVSLAGRQGSHLLGAMAEADGLVDVPPATVWETGRSVRVLRWE